MDRKQRRQGKIYLRHMSLYLDKIFLYLKIKLKIKLPLVLHSHVTSVKQNDIDCWCLIPLNGKQNNTDMVHFPLYTRPFLDMQETPKRNKRPEGETLCILYVISVISYPGSIIITFFSLKRRLHWHYTH